MAVQRVSHIGICVADLDRSLAIYRDALGFREQSSSSYRGDAVDRLLGLQGVKLRSVFLERDGTRLELLCFAAPPLEHAAAPGPMNRPGFTHLSLRVDDLDATVASLRSAGAEVLEDTRFDDDDHGVAAVFVLDPDGTRIELVKSPGDPAILPGEPATPGSG